MFQKFNDTYINCKILTQQHYQNQSEKQDDGVDLIVGLPKGLN